MILFSNQNGIQQDRLRMAYNNDALRFYSTIAANPKYCDVVTDGLSIRLYPAPDNTFFLNFKPYVTAMINTRQFADTTVTDLDGTAQSCSYDFRSGTLMYRDVTFTIALDNDAEDVETFTLSWFAGVQQMGYYKYLSRSEDHVLLPFKKENANTYYAKYWQGYPFDIGFYIAGTTLYIDNDTNLQNASFPVENVARLFFSDGRTDETIEDVLPLVEYYNYLRVRHSETKGVNDKFVVLYKEPYQCGVYLKWLNAQGGYSYWLFADTWAIDRASKSIGEISHDDYNLEFANNRILNLGQESIDTLKVVAELLTNDDLMIVEGILESPKVYLFTGQPFSRNGVNDWIEVTLKSNGARTKNFKGNLTNMALDFELPKRFTQTL